MIIIMYVEFFNVFKGLVIPHQFFLLSLNDRGLQVIILFKKSASKTLIFLLLCSPHFNFIIFNRIEEMMRVRAVLAFNFCKYF